MQLNEESCPVCGTKIIGCFRPSLVYRIPAWTVFVIFSLLLLGSIAYILWAAPSSRNPKQFALLVWLASLPLYVLVLCGLNTVLLASRKYTIGDGCLSVKGYAENRHIPFSELSLAGFSQLTRAARLHLNDRTSLTIGHVVLADSFFAETDFFQTLWCVLARNGVSVRRFWVRSLFWAEPELISKLLTRVPGFSHPAARRLYKWLYVTAYTIVIALVVMVLTMAFLAVVGHR
jgi:hypothetical protein